jgi:formamidopyrimidine-DNA glycosylase
MPELPEVETVRRGLAATVVGRRVEAVHVTGARTVRRTSAEAVVAGLTGTTVVAADRRGKYLLLPVDSGALGVVHLRMSGQLLLARAGAAPDRHAHVVLSLAGGDELRFVDPRTFGEVVVVDGTRLAEDAPWLAALGPDALVELPSAAGLHRLLASRSRMLKHLLLDQHTIAGLGNIYTDEILHRAGLAPYRGSADISPAEAAALRRAVRNVLAEAIDARGSSLGDGQYVDLMGEAGGYQARHRVYGRPGQPCLRCRTPIERAKWAGRSTFWCPRCQT